MSTELTPNQRSFYEAKFNHDPWSNTFEFGGGRTKDGQELIKPWKRVHKSTKTYGNKVPNYREGKGSILPYQGKYLLEYGIPNGIISHRCDNPKNRKSTSCIEETHMTDADTDDNNGRRQCHDKIIEWAKPLQAKGLLEIRVVFCSDVPVKSEYETAIEHGLKRSTRLNDKRKNVAPNYHKCPHAANGCCFVNFGQH